MTRTSALIEKGEVGNEHSAKWRTQDKLRERVHRLIPGGAHTYSKGDDQFPANAPAFIVRGKGATVWDSDANAYLDWGMGLRSVVLGHAYPRVVDDVREQLELGSNFVRPSPIEVDLADALLSLLPGADMVKFAKNGSDVTTAAIRLARAYTGRKYVAMCRDNPFYSFDDWFIGTTVVDAGVPSEISSLTLPFAFGDLTSLQLLFDEYPDQIACVIVEPAATALCPPAGGCQLCIERIDKKASETGVCPNAAFLASVKELTSKQGALLIFDEMITGLRWDLPGAQSLYRVEPDLSCFGKALGNGFSVSALAGKRDIMELGGIRQTDRPKVFLLSATNGGETHALAAALAVIREMQAEPVIDHLWCVGAALQLDFNQVSESAGTRDHIWMDGYSCSPMMTFLGPDAKPSPELRTLFLQEMVERGVLMPYLAPSYSHAYADVEQTVEAASRALEICHRALNDGYNKYLRGPVIKPVFRKFS